MLADTKIISGAKRSIKITDHFTCTPANVIYCRTCTHCKKRWIGETEIWLGDLLREHLRDLESNDKDACKPVSIHFNLSCHSMQHMALCGVSLHLCSSESCKTLEQNFSFKSALLIRTVSTNALHSTYLFLFSRHYIPTNSVAPFFSI